MPELQRLSRKLQPLATDKMPLAVSPPRNSRFGSPLELSRVHWVKPELVVEVKYLAWSGDNLLRQVVYEGLREDKLAAEVRRPVADRKPAASARPLPRLKRHRSGWPTLPFPVGFQRSHYPVVVRKELKFRR